MKKEYKKEHKPGELLEKSKKTHEHKEGKKNWIAGAIKHPGALHHELGVKKGEKIPAGKLAHAAAKGGVEGRRARLAETLKGFKHKGKEMGMMHKHAMKMMDGVAKTAMHEIDRVHKEHGKHMAHLMKGHAHKDYGFSPNTDTTTAVMKKAHEHKHMKKHEKKEAHKKHEKA